ncbi:MAG: DNA-processing protein DprA [Candidatus Eisenbacteria bacterium]|jgi:DNA processing protein|nr:DNA-processing protein DprA [Candidatus Eisenbacteria bacterium]
MEKGESRLTASVDTAELASWLTLSGVAGIGDQKIAILIQRLGGPREVLDAPPRMLAAILGQDEPRVVRAIREAKDQGTAKQVEALRTGDYRLYTIWDHDYPPSLRNIPSPPVLLYTRGAFLSDDRRAVAIVGSRAATEYGKTVAYDLGRDLATAGLVVVSGLARGVDSFAHQAALDAGGRTLAVLGNGPDVAYPPENRKLMQEIAGQGVVVSEFPPLTSPNPKHFPRRNRIIAALSMGVIVVQARETSGALITAQHALEQGKEVMAVPGPINARTSKGPHGLIKQGAALVEDVDDVLAALGEPLPARGSRRPDLPVPKLDGDEQTLLRALGTDPAHIDALCARTGEPSGRLLARLLQLELKGVVKQLAGKQFLALIQLDEQ